MKRLLLSATVLFATAVSLAVAAPAVAQRDVEYDITIYNLTRNQPFSPPLVATHASDVAIFEPGQAALPELAALAEDGMTGPLADLLSTLSSVGDVGVAGGPIPPGGSATIRVNTSFPMHRLSVVGMLVNTNDAFFGLNTVTLPRGQSQSASFYALAYDAGSETNNEDCDFIPGPSCAGAGAGNRDTGGAEGFVFVHAGVHGGADLDPAADDWRNPVAKIVAVRVN